MTCSRFDPSSGAAPGGNSPLSVAAALLVLFWLSACGATKLRLPGPQAQAQPPARVLLVLLDGVHEPTFRSLLDAGELPHLARLLEPDPAGERRGTYTRATSVWPSTTGPAYVPFIAGLYPRKSNLVGIRQYLRELMVFRSYCGSDATIIEDDLTREFPTIYEVLDLRESFNQAGFVSRRGWDDRGRAQKPLHENLNSIPGFIHSYLPPVDDTADLYNALSFVNYVSPEFGHHRIMALGSFEGRYYDWSVPLGTLRLAYEELFSLLGLERVLRELNLDARKLGRLPQFSLISLHLPDVTGHKYGLGAEYEEGLKRVDEIVGFMLEVFRHQGVLEDLTLIVTSDHGLSATERHFPLLERLAADTGVAIHDTVAASTDDFNLKWRGALGLPGLQQRWAGIGAVSGNANVQIYLRKPGSRDTSSRPSYRVLRAYPRDLDVPDGETVDLVRALLAYPEVSHVFASEREERRHHVWTRQGEAVIEVREDDEGRLSYRYRIVSGRDPLGYANQAEARALLDSGGYFEGDRWAAATRHTLYPDGVVQVAQLLEAKAAGDLIVEPAPGVEPWNQGQRAVHGALHRDQLVVPLLIHGPDLDVDKAELLFARGPMPRTVDVYPTVLELLGERPPRSVAWRVSKWLGLRKVNRRATMRTDIDGRTLDIWAPRVPTTSR